MNTRSIRALRQVHFIVAMIIGIPALFAQAPDTLFYTNGSQILGSVEEIGTDKITYRTNSGSGDIKVSVMRTEIMRVGLGNGQQLIINKAVGPDEVRDTGGMKNAIKMDFLAPAFNHAVVGYERVLGRNTNLEIKLGYIGLGEYLGYRNLSGGMAKVGIKFIRHQRKYWADNVPVVHAFAGGYIKPEIIFSAWTSEKGYDNYEPYPYPIYPYPSYGYQLSKTSSSVAFNLTLGQQFRIGRYFLFDVFGGVGYGARWTVKQDGQGGSSDTTDHEQYNFSHAFFSNSTPLSVSAGVMFGVVF